ncbi:MAG: right-handed parallel beta-helix repeat-containing protein [Desulfosarcina sp.]|nr:right-handed parallel beta-helix repeat-containing protein [Desulfobacterales bacterium]
MRKMSKISLTLLGAMLSIFLVAGTASAVAPGAPCPATITANDCGCVADQSITYTLSGHMICDGQPGNGANTRHGIIIATTGVTIDGAGYELSGGSVANRNCEVLVAPEGHTMRMWCVGHPCRQAADGGVLDSGIVNANVLDIDYSIAGDQSKSSCNALAPMGQGGCDDLTVKNLTITGWCDGIWVSGDCDTGETPSGGNPGRSGYTDHAEYRLTEIVIEGNCIKANGNDECGAYTPCPDGDGGDWAHRCYNDAIFTAQIGLDNSNTPGFIGTSGAPGLGREYMIGDLEFPDLYRDGGKQNDDRNFIWHNKIYGQKGCTCVSCAGGNGVNLQGGLEIDDVIWCGGNEIEKNVIKNCSTSGIHYTHATTYNRIHGNYLLGNGLGGIANGCVWCSGSYIYDNVAEGNYGLGIGVAAMAKIKNNIVTDTQPVKNAEFTELGYGSLPGDGILTTTVCDPLAVAAGICTANEGSELLGNTTVGNANLDIFDFSGPAASAYGDENMCQNTSGNYADANPATPTSNCRYAGGARLNCRGDINHDCLVNITDYTILNNQWQNSDCCPCAKNPESAE